MAAMMPATRSAGLEPAFDDDDDDHESLAASLEDFEEHEQRLIDLPSQHSGFRSDPEESDTDDRSSSGAPWSPPGFKTRAWYRHEPYLNPPLRPSTSPSRSRHTSPEYQDAEQGDADVTLAANIPLPVGTDSPMKERSPEPESVADDDMMRDSDPPASKDDDNSNDKKDKDDDSNKNFIRFALRAEVQHREPLAPIINFIRHRIDAMTRSRMSMLFTTFIGLLALTLARVIMVPPIQPPVPDLVKLSSLARSFEPLIFYSENGHPQIMALQETSIAVWDLGESVRNANMTSAPLIVKGLDELSDSLKILGSELTQFFADVDSDVDGILIVMDWARRELLGVTAGASSSLPGQIYDHMHRLLNRGGLLEGPGGPTPLGTMLSTVFGVSSHQRTRATMTRTFHEFLNILEESINNELTHSTALFRLFESIDRQFLNLQRLVVRETDTQERMENDLLSSLWTRVIGTNAAVLRKFEKNKQLLASLRARTVTNKLLVVDHHGRLQTLKANLETLRRRLVSPLVRRNDSVSIDGANVIEDQIKGLAGTYDYLNEVREKQKNKLLEMIYGAKLGKTQLVGGTPPVAIGVS